MTVSRCACAGCGVVLPLDQLFVAPSDALAEKFGDAGRCDSCWQTAEGAPVITCPACGGSNVQQLLPTWCDAAGRPVDVDLEAEVLAFHCDCDRNDNEAIVNGEKLRGRWI